MYSTSSISNCDSPPRGTHPVESTVWTHCPPSPLAVTFTCCGVGSGEKWMMAKPLVLVIVALTGFVRSTYMISSSSNVWPGSGMSVISMVFDVSPGANLSVPAAGLTSSFSLSSFRVA
jgi:hypothetical protein